MWHALGTSTSKIDLRVIFLCFDVEPRVATSLESCQQRCVLIKKADIPDGGNACLARRKDCTDVKDLGVNRNRPPFSTYFHGSRTC